MLRASSSTHDETIELEAVMNSDVSSGIPHGEALVRFAEAVVGRNADEIRGAREALVAESSAEAMVDAAGVISNFQRMVRIADSTGIGLGNFEPMTEDLRHDLGIEDFRERKAAGALS